MLTLKQPSGDDFPIIYDWRKSLASNKWFFSDFDVTFESHVDWIENIERDTSQLYFGVYDNDSIIGTIGLYDIDLVNKHAQYGRFLICESEQGKGYGKQALIQLLLYGFCVLGLNKIYGHILFDNQYALRMVLKLGFVLVAKLKQHVFKQGKYHDVMRVAITRESFSGGILDLVDITPKKCS